MNMKIIKSEKCLCICCMEEHNVKTVIVDEKTTFKNTTVKYKATYLYCLYYDKDKIFYMDEQQMRENNMRMKDAYRKSLNMLESA